LEDILVSQLADYLFENDGYIYPNSTVKIKFEKDSKKPNFEI